MKPSAEKKGKALFILINILAVAFFVLLLSSKIPLIGRILTLHDKNYGDLYVLSKVDYFKHEIPELPGEGSFQFDPIAEAHVICFGDSYLDMHHGLFPFELKRQTGEKTAYIYIRTLVIESRNPIVLLMQEGYRPKGHTILVWEIAEREINIGMADPNVSPGEVRDRYEKDENKYTVFLRKVAITLFDQKKFEYLFLNTPVMAKLLSGIYSTRFFLLGEISDLTPRYSLNPRMLFHRSEVGSNERVFSNNEIDEYADLVEKIAKRLEEDYNIRLIFLPVPDKYSIYGDLASAGPYNNFIPRLTEELDRRGVPTVDLYTEYITYRRTHGDEVLLYYPSDTHWSQKGIDIAVTQVVDLIRKDMNDDPDAKKTPLLP